MHNEARNRDRDARIAALAIPVVDLLSRMALSHGIAERQAEYLAIVHQEQLSSALRVSASTDHP
jgi:hypothetical protein